MRRDFRRTFLLVMAFLTFCVGATPLAAYSSVAPPPADASALHCAMTRQVGCGCCHTGNGDAASADGQTAVTARCACTMTPSPAAPSAPSPGVAAPVLLYAMPLSVAATILPTFFPKAATPPVGSHAPPPRPAASAPDAGRAPPAF